MSEKSKSKSENMSPIVEYIQTLPVPAGTKWFCTNLAYADKRVFTQKWLVVHTNFDKRNVRHYLYKLIDCGVVSRHREGNDFRYVISDPRFIHHMAAEKNGFEPIRPGDGIADESDETQEE